MPLTLPPTSRPRTPVEEATDKFLDKLRDLAGHDADTYLDFLSYAEERIHSRWEFILSEKD